MATKELVFGIEARSALARGAEKVCKAVVATLGPKGRNVIIERQFQQPHVTKDGVTVAKEITLKDPFEALGADLVKEAASKTNDGAGDGTTTATLLAYSIYKEGSKLVAAGMNPIDVKREIDADVKQVVDKLKMLARPVETNDDIKKIATISANGDEKIGGMIAEAIEKIGKDGVIAVKDGQTTETELEVVNGMQFNRGWVSPYFITDAERSEAVLEDCYVLVADMRVSTIVDLKSVIEAVAKAGKSVAVIAEEVEGEALPVLIINKQRGTLRVAAARLPGYGDEKRACADDIAAVTGGKVIRQDLGFLLEKTSLADLGYAKRITFGKDTTTIVEGGASKDSLEGHIAQLERTKEASKNDYEKERLTERIARLRNGIAVIRVGAATESEAKERKDRVVDAVHATKAAISEGIVVGGGKALLEASKHLPHNSVVALACGQPATQIAENAGKNGSLIAEKMLAMAPTDGYDASTGEFGNLIDLGILDPVKVTRLALQNAASVAGLLITTEAAITDERIEKK